MPVRSDPARLEGEDLDRWYRRSPQEVEQERRAAANERYQAFFGNADASGLQDSVFTDPRSDEASGDRQDALWVADGSGGYRAVHPGVPDYQLALEAPPDRPEGLPERSAEPERAGLVYVGNPHNPRLRREWEAAYGLPWPKTEEGRNYHVAHKRAIADGGANALDNIEPMHPDEHLAQHINNGDSARWGRRPWTARAFGGRVLPPAPGVRLNGFGLWQALSNGLGILSGRVRTDTPVHFWYDMAGYPAPGDENLMIDPNCRSMGITKLGAICK